MHHYATHQDLRRNTAAAPWDPLTKQPPAPLAASRGEPRAGTRVLPALPHSRSHARTPLGFGLPTSLGSHVTFRMGIISKLMLQT